MQEFYTANFSASHRLPASRRRALDKEAREVVKSAGLALGKKFPKTPQGKAAAERHLRKIKDVLIDIDDNEHREFEVAEGFFL